MKRRDSIVSLRENVKKMRRKEMNGVKCILFYKKKFKIWRSKYKKKITNYRWQWENHMKDKVWLEAHSNRLKIRISILKAIVIKLWRCKSN